jgi:hypothetical protein
MINVVPAKRKIKRKEKKKYFSVQVIAFENKNTEDVV